MVRSSTAGTSTSGPWLVTNQESMYTIVMGIQRLVNPPRRRAGVEPHHGRCASGYAPPLLVVLGMQKLFVRGLVETEK